jgi:hypothetical protein
MIRRLLELEVARVADELGELPPSPGSAKGPGWYPVGSKLNEQSYWDGERWTDRRRWNGAAWAAIPMPQGWAPGRPDQSAAGPRRTNRRVVAWVAIVLAVVLAAVLVFVFTRGPSTPGSNSAPSSVPASTAPSTSSPVTVPQASPAEVAACESDAKMLEVALEAYMAQKGSFPSPPSSWSAVTYAGNFLPLTSTASGGPYLPKAPATTNYVMEYDASGHVWIAPPGAYGAIYNPGQGFDTNPDVCEAAVR